MDMIVNLYTDEVLWKGDNGYGVRRAFISDMDKVLDFVESNFKDEYGWKAIVERAMLQDKCVIAVLPSGEIVGFGCWDSEAKGYAGPVGVKMTHRNLGIGSDILCKCLEDMKSYGYGYAILGSVPRSVHGFFERSVSAVEIVGSDQHKTLYGRRVKRHD